MHKYLNEMHQAGNYKFISLYSITIISIFMALHQHEK